MNSDIDFDPRDIVTDHRRQWRDCLYVYPVVSRRAKGLSIGVNLNIDKRCNFSCLYCQINRKLKRKHKDVQVSRLSDELYEVIQEALSGELWNDPRFVDTPDELRRINDIAFSGDGEPTCLKNFDEAVAAAANAIQAVRPPEPVKIVVITNASQLRSPQVRRALPILDDNNGEIWAKLDAGTQEYFRKVNRPAPGLTLEDICDNILAVAVAHPVVIQSLFFRIDDQPPPPEEIDAYCDRLRWLISCGGRLQLVQLHTIARSPACAEASALGDDELAKIANTVRSHISPVPVEVYPGRDVPPQRA